MLGLFNKLRYKKVYIFKKQFTVFIHKHEAYNKSYYVINKNILPMRQDMKMEGFMKKFLSSYLLMYIF